MGAIDQQMARQLAEDDILWARFRDSEGAEGVFRVSDISSNGIAGYPARPLTVGQFVIVSIEGLGRLRVRVAWTENGICGCEITGGPKVDPLRLGVSLQIRRLDAHGNHRWKRAGND